MSEKPQYGLSEQTPKEPPPNYEQAMAGTPSGKTYKTRLKIKDTFEI